MRLVAAAGHDLRTPMTRMRLRTEFIEDEEERAAWLKDINELDRIADSAIRLVREEVSSDPKEPVDLGGLVREIATELGDLGMSVKLKPMDRAEIVVPPFAMKRALQEPDHQRRDPWRRCRGRPALGQAGRHHRHRGQRPRHSRRADRARLRAVLPGRRGAPAVPPRRRSRLRHRARDHHPQRRPADDREPPCRRPVPDRQLRCRAGMKRESRPRRAAPA